MTRRPTLSLNEWAVLGVLADQPRHGYDIAAELQPGTAIGDAWRLTRQLVYRALERLDALGLAEPRRTEASDVGPPRTVYGATRRGRAALRAWLDTPVSHLRDVRSALLLKLVLLERLGLERGPLVRAQRVAFAPHLDRLNDAPPRDHVIALWRRHSAAAAAAFLDELATDAEAHHRR
ncbi:MAG: PadR family transcriptional regulator [Acidimicrobiales bacterium]